MTNEFRQGDAMPSATRSRVTNYDLGHGDVVIAAITSCTNTSNPSVMMAARGDRGHHDVAVSEIVVRAFDLCAAGRRIALPEFLLHGGGEPVLAWVSGTRSCGRFGPASEGIVTSPRSSASVSV